MLELDLLIDSPLPEEGRARGLFPSSDLPRVSLAWRQARDKHRGVRQSCSHDPMPTTLFTTSLLLFFPFFLPIENTKSQLIIPPRTNH